MFPHLPGEGLYSSFSGSFPPPSLLPSSFPQRQTPDLRYLSGHCLTSTANSRSQWAPDLNDEVQISVGAAGPQRRAADLSGHCWTSTARARSQWAAGRASPSGECPCQRGCQNRIECQKECRNECQVEWQNRKSE